ncbi:MAG TPA: primosomal protein N' [Microbacterium sp.]|nr:primosomal protein N' [Microbacterium sp.]
MARPVARVLIDSPLPQLDRLFDYRVPEPLIEQAQPGLRVRVPLRSAGRVVDGFVIDLVDDDGSRQLSSLETVVSAMPVLPAGLYALARRVADRAAGSASDILRLVIPKRQVRVEKAWLAADPPRSAPVAPETLAWADDLLGSFPGLGEALAAGERVAVDAPPHPTKDASGATIGVWATLLAAAAVRTLAAGRSAVLVVPDYRDQAQLEAALAGRVPDDALVVDDATRPNPERYRAFLRTLAPDPCIVVGKRSAVYTPVPDLGLLAIWDDGDPLLEEPLAPYVHARDAALVRQELHGSALLFAGHTRTTDVERLVALGWVRDLPAARRESARVVLGAEHAVRPGERVPSAAFQTAREALRHGPVLIQVARPGYAPVLVCAQCRAPARCAHCGGPLHARAARAAPACTWCGRTAVGWQCPHCESTQVRFSSSGSERTADELGRAFPDTRVIIADGEHPVLRIDHRPALVVATRGAEPIAEGGYRAVILLDGDRMLLADALRIGESCLRWWSNAAALAASGCPVHLVGVSGPVARALATWNQAGYARSELAARAPLLMPPTVRVASVTGTPQAVERTMAEVRASVPDLPSAAILGPVRLEDDPATMRALVRFEYGEGRAVTETLRAAVVADALRGRRRKGGAGARNTLRVRVDVPDPEL